MKLFLRIYSYLLIGMIGLLAIEANINYELEIKQFELDMTRNARQIGAVVSGMITHAWHESGPEKAIQLIDDANDSNYMIRIRWVWLEDLLIEHQENEDETRQLATLVKGQSISFVKEDSLSQKHRYTYVPVSVPGNRPGALELTQSLAPLVEFTRQTLVRSLIVTSLLALLSGVIIYVFIHIKIRGPLDRLSRKAIEIGKGNIETDLEVKGNDELTDLAQSMNDMCSRLLIAKEKIHFEYEARLKTLEQLRHTEQLSTIGQISAGIAHEMGTPLNVVDGRAKMIITEDLEKDEIIDCAEIIKNQAEKMTHIIRQLLDFSRIRKPQKAVESVDVLVRQVFRLLAPIAAKQGIMLHLEIEPDTRLTSHVDAPQIQQVLMNIIMNGIQAMSTPGTITVTLSNVEIQSLERTDGQRKIFQKMDIADQGGGISAENIKKIFDPFFTTKKIGTGTGLGLSIVRELLEEHHGWVEIKSSTASGTTFTIHLPLSWEKNL